MGGILSHQPSQKPVRGQRAGHTTVVVQTSAAPPTEVKEETPDQAVQPVRVTESPSPTQAPAIVSEDSHTDLPPTPKRPASKHASSKPTTPKSGSSKPSTPKNSHVKSPPSIPPLATSEMLPQVTENRSQSSVPSFPPINQQSRFHTTSGYSHGASSPRKGSKASSSKPHAKSTSMQDYSAPGYIEHDAKPNANENKSKVDNKTVIEDDAILIDLTPGNTPRNAEQSGYGNINSKSSFTMDRRNTGRDGFDSEKFRQANSRKTNHSRENDYDSRPSVSRPINSPPYSSAAGYGKTESPYQSERTINKPKFMGPVKQVFTADDEILLEDLLEVGR